MGIGKKWAKPFSFLSHSSKSWHHFFSFFAKIVKNGWRKRQNGEKGSWKIVKAAMGPFLHFSRSSNLAVFHLLCHSKPILAPFETRYWPLSKPVLGLSCIVYVLYLDTHHFEPNHSTTLDHHCFVEPVGGFIHGKETLGNQFAQYVWSRVWER